MKPHVFGVYHTIRHPDVPLVLSTLRSAISSDALVGIECPHSLDELFAHKNDAALFWQEITRELISLGARVIPVEDERLYRLRARRRTWWMYEGSEARDADWIWQKLSVLTSMSLLAHAQNAGCDYLVTGIYHAYDLQQLGHTPVTLLSELSESEREQEDRWIAKWGRV